MNKTDLVTHIAETHEIPKTVANAIVGSVFDSIMEAVKSGEGATFPGFGTFKLSERAARKGFNPKTKEPIDIAASKAPRFTPGSAFKSLVADEA